MNVASVDDSSFEELVSFATQLECYSARVFDAQLQFFEHGVGTQINNSGGCIDHAHLHAISMADKLLPELRKHCHLTRLPDLVAARQVCDVVRGYILVTDEHGAAWVSNSPRVPSQLLRKLYASCQTSPAVWNWRLDPRIDEVINVIGAYSGFNYKA